MAVPLPTSSAPTTPKTASKPAVAGQENLSDTVSDSVSPALTGQPFGQPVLNKVGTDFNTMAQLQQLINMSDARADQADDRQVDIPRDVKSLLAKTQDTSKENASLAQVGQAETADVASSVAEAATADLAADSAQWEALQRFFICRAAHHRNGRGSTSRATNRCFSWRSIQSTASRFGFCDHHGHPQRHCPDAATIRR